MKIRNYLYLTIFIIQVCMPAGVHADIFNGDFELSEPNAIIDTNTPTGWQTKNYVNVVSNFIPEPNQANGNADDWKIDIVEGLNPFEGQSFVVLSNSDVKPEPTYAHISQQIEVLQGQTLAGMYFFGTCDYIPFEDYATIKLIPNSNSNLRDIILININVNDVGSFSSMAGWEKFEHTFTQEEAGFYELVLSVTDSSDIIYKSYLAVDNIRLCYTPEQGDLNQDCRVNMIDFAFLANDWLNDCSDPDYYSDPNSLCKFGTDINGDGPVDMKDLFFIAQNWLTGE